MPLSACSRQCSRRGTGTAVWRLSASSVKLAKQFLLCVWLPSATAVSTSYSLSCSFIRPSSSMPVMEWSNRFSLSWENVVAHVPGNVAAWPSEAVASAARTDRAVFISNSPLSIPSNEIENLAQIRPTQNLRLQSPTVSLASHDRKCLHPSQTFPVHRHLLRPTRRNFPRLYPSGSLFSIGSILRFKKTP